MLRHFWIINPNSRGNEPNSSTTRANPNASPRERKIAAYKPEKSGNYQSHEALLNMAEVNAVKDIDILLELPFSTK